MNGQADFGGYPERGYCWPLSGLAVDQADEALSRFLEYRQAHIAFFETGLPRNRIALTIDTHLSLRWVTELALHPAILDAVDKVIGPDFMVWNTHWFPKFPGDGSYVSWHQDAAYWGLSPPDVTTAWLALTPSTEANGCLRVLPGSHTGELLPQVETYAPNNMLSRGQEIAVEIDESQAVSLELNPGEFSLHHIGIAHGSGPNTASISRIGLAIRYVAAHVIQAGPQRDMVLMARGTDHYGNFEVVDPPKRDFGLDEPSLQKVALQRKLENNSTQGQIKQ